MPIELQGYDRIHYTNYVYPWDGRAFLQPPMVDEEYNPAGSYVKEFDLDAGLVGKRVCVSFQGAEQALYVWLNGEFVGYGEDSFTPSEFDITELVREKGNRLCVRVYKKSSASWIEDQDFFRFSGLFRDVYLYAKPESHVEDLWIKAGLMEDYQTGVLEAQVKVSGERPAKYGFWRTRMVTGCWTGSLRKRPKARQRPGNPQGTARLPSTVFPCGSFFL